MTTIEDLRDVLAEEPTDLREPDLEVIVRSGTRLSRRRRRTVAGGLVAASVVGLAGGVLVVREMAASDSGVAGGAAAPGPDSGFTPAQVAARAEDARRSVGEMRATVREYFGAPDLVLEEDTYVLGEPDADTGPDTLPQGDGWASMLWWRARFDLGPDTEGYLLVENSPVGEAAAEDPGSACTNVLGDCVERAVADGLVGIERGSAAESGSGTGRAVRVSFVPDDPDRSTVMLEIVTPDGDSWRAQDLVGLVTSPTMSIPQPGGPTE